MEEVQPSISPSPSARWADLQHIRSELCPIFLQWQDAPPTIIEMKHVFTVTHLLNQQEANTIYALLDLQLTDAPHALIYAHNLVQRASEFSFQELVLWIAVDIRANNAVLANQLVEEAVNLEKETESPFIPDE